MADAKGLFYAPSPPPQSGGEAELRQWCEREFSRIATSMREGRSQSLRLDTHYEVPPRVFEGLIVFFAPAVVGPEAGLYEHRSATWHKL